MSLWGTEQGSGGSSGAESGLGTTPVPVGGVVVEEVDRGGGGGGPVQSPGPLRTNRYPGAGTGVPVPGRTLITCLRKSFRWSRGPRSVLWREGGREGHRRDGGGSVGGPGPPVGRTPEKGLLSSGRTGNPSHTCRNLNDEGPHPDTKVSGYEGHDPTPPDPSVRSTPIENGPPRVVRRGRAGPRRPSFPCRSTGRRRVCRARSPEAPFWWYE